MSQCSCCGRDNEQVKKYRLPTIGYGSMFDVVEDDEVICFNLCPECCRRINRWIKRWHPKIDLNEFWKCNIVKMNQHMQPIKDGEDTYYEEFQYEDILLKLFLKFMPEAYYLYEGDITLLDKLRKWLRRMFM